MWWQALVLTVCAAGFPALVLLYFIGGPNYRDESFKAKAKANAKAKTKAGAAQN